SILERVTGAEGARYAGFAAVICAAVILARIAWVTAAMTFSRWTHRRRPEGTGDALGGVAISAPAAAVAAWCGMRGTVTLAAALALPTAGHGGGAFPYRDLIVVTAFGVVLGTLVLQGLTLRPLMLRLKLEDDGQVEREVRLARVETLRAALAAAETCPGAETAELVRHRYALQLSRAEEAAAVPDGTVDGAAGDADAAVVAAATRAQRQRLVALRADGTIGDAAFQRVEEELDWAELDWERLVQAGRTGEGEG
ncbi:MAG TPA: cation:proton antiporter, partial [Longimicrobium sp.]|nr:cation:proton antiporter [Longimicrobium sp.]